MKCLQAKGLGSNKRQAEPITEQEEDKLWEMGLLGDHCPHRYYNGLHFALRSGREHRQLRLRPCRCVKKQTRRIKRKEYHLVDHHEKVDLPQRCFVRLHKKYISLCPKNPDFNAFYLQPAAKPTRNVGTLVGL